MARPFPERIKDYLANPEQWEVVKIEVVPSTNKRNRGGKSIQELLRHKGTGEDIVRHTVVKPNGRPFRQPHFRDSWGGFQ